jgi:hypothetical protein
MAGAPPSQFGAVSRGLRLKTRYEVLATSNVYDPPRKIIILVYEIYLLIK